MTIAEIIDRALARHEHNQKKLADSMGLAPSTVSRWYTTGKGVDFESALRLADAADVPARVVLEAAGQDATLLRVVRPSEDIPPPDDIEAAVRQALPELRDALVGIPPSFHRTIIRTTMRGTADQARTLGELLQMAETTPEDITPARPETKAPKRGRIGWSRRQRPEINPRELAVA